MGRLVLVIRSKCIAAATLERDHVGSLLVMLLMRESNNAIE